MYSSYKQGASIFIVVVSMNLPPQVSFATIQLDRLTFDMGAIHEPSSEYRRQTTYETIGTR